MRNALMSLCTIDEVTVTREIVGYGHTWMITFNDLLYAGDVAGELVADDLGLHGTNFNVIVQTERAVVGRLPYHYIIPGLDNSVNYFIRVTAYNNLGTGEDIISEPEFIMPAKQKPMIPQNVQVSVATSSSIHTTWAAPVSSGGD